MTALRLVHIGSLAMLLLVMALAPRVLADEPAADAPAPKPYPLKVCIVSDDPLGEMGEPPVIIHEGQEIKFCCKHCIAQFKADPDKYIAKMNKIVAQAPATQPTKQADHDAEHKD